MVHNHEILPLSSEKSHHWGNSWVFGADSDWILPSVTWWGGERAEQRCRSERFWRRRLGRSRREGITRRESSREDGGGGEGREGNVSCSSDSPFECSNCVWHSFQPDFYHFRTLHFLVGIYIYTYETQGFTSSFLPSFLPSALHCQSWMRS